MDGEMVQGMDIRQAPDARSSSPLTRAVRFVRALLLASLVLAALLAIAWSLLGNRLDEEIRSHVHARLAQHYPELSVTVKSARRIAGEGIEIRGITIAKRVRGSQQGEKPLLSVDEVFASCDCEFSQLMTGTLQVRKLTVRGARLRATQLGDGSWDVACLFPPPRFSNTPPPILIENSSADVNVHTAQGERHVSLRDIDLCAESLDSAVPSPSGDAGAARRVDIHGSVGGTFFDRAELTAQIDTGSGVWTATSTLAGLELTPQLLAMVGAPSGSDLTLLAGLRAKANLDCQLSGQAGSKTPMQYVVSGRIEQGDYHDPQLPYPLSSLQADVYCNNRLLRIENMSARSGPTTFQLACEYSRTAPDEGLRLQIQAQHLALDQQLAEILPDELIAIWNKLAPSGVVNVDLSLDSAGGKSRTTLLIDCLDVSIAYHAFPYRLENVVGRVRFRDDVLTVENLQGLASGQLVRIEGVLNDPGPRATGSFQLSSAGPLPLDGKIIAAMNPRLQAVVRSLQPSGLVSLTSARLERTSPDGPWNKQFDIDLHNCSVRYDKFPYPLTGIHGKLEVRNGQTEFRDLYGYNSSVYVECRGVWESLAGGGSRLVLDFLASDVELDSELREAVEALNPGAKRLWSNLRPRGTIDQLAVDVTYTSADEHLSLDIRAQKWLPGRTVEGRTLTVEPTWFPYRMENVTGAVRFRDGVIDLENVRAVHGPTSVTLDGKCDVREGRWSVQLGRLIADGLEANHELVSALPGRLGEALSRLKAAGLINLNGKLNLAGSAVPGTPVTSSWDVELDMENGRIDCGIQLEDIRGGVRLWGERNEQGFFSRGELAVDSLVYRGAQFTQVRGPLWLDQTRVLLGTRAEVQRRDRTPRQVTARVFGGTFAGDAEIALAEHTPFAVECSLSEGDLVQISRDLNVQRQNIRGKAFALLRLSGNSSGAHTLRGDGLVRLRDADIYELPLMVALLSLLTNQTVDRTAFTKSDINFRVQGDIIHFDRINFKGDAFSLKGHGWMDLHKQINLNFYALVGRDELRVPIISPLLEGASRSILEIQVVGTLNRPEVYRYAFPELDETLQRLFPELANSTPMLQMPNPLNPLNRLSRSPELPR